jgi:hypothetical protein
MSQIHTNEVYTDLMTPGFVQGIETANQGTEPLCSAVIRGVSEADWEGSGLPIVKYGNNSHEIGERDATPEQYAKKLASIAFEDAETIVSLCRNVPSEQFPNGVSFQDMLRASKNNLLSIARLIDGDKTDIFLCIKHPMMSEQFARDIDPENPIVVTTSSRGTSVFDWNASIKNRIRRLTPDTQAPGCPAHYRVVEIDGRKQTLIHAFWDAFVTEAL